MTLSASDLPESTRRQILEKVRQQVGEDPYREMLKAVGEDGIIKALLNVGTATIAVPSKKTIGKKVSGFLSGVIFLIVSIGVIAGFFWSLGNFKQWYGKAIAGVLLVPYLLYLADFKISTKEFFPTLLGIFAVLVSAVLLIWGLVQGLARLL